LACSVERVKEGLRGFEGVSNVEEALSGKGVRIVLSEPLPLAALPPQVVEEFLGCDVVELVYPDGRVVYVARRWLERVVGSAPAGGESERAGSGG